MCALYIAKCARGAGENGMSLRHGLHGPSAKAGKRSHEYVIPRNVAPAFKPPPVRICFHRRHPIGRGEWIF